MSDCGNYLVLYLAKASPDDLLYYIDLEQTAEITGNLSINPIVTDPNGGYSVSQFRNTQKKKFRKKLNTN